MPTHRLRTALAAAALAALATVLPAGPAAAADVEVSPAATLPVTYNPLTGVPTALLNPGASPPGANNWSCRPSSAHPYPVVLVHGTFGVMSDNFSSLSPLLYNRGYCVFALNYGGPANSPAQAVGDIVTSAGQLSAFIDRVLAATGAAKVDIVGHSQGGMMPRYYLRFLGGAPKVHHLVALAGINHGSTYSGLVNLVELFDVLGITNSLLSATCPACLQMERGSAFLTKLNSGGDTVPGVQYTVIETAYDTVVTPYTSAFLSGGAVKNILLQDRCALDLVDHIGIAFDPIALAHVLNALDPAHPVPVPCFLVLPIAPV